MESPASNDNVWKLGRQGVREGCIGAEAKMQVKQGFTNLAALQA